MHWEMGAKHGWKKDARSQFFLHKSIYFILPSSTDKASANRWQAAFLLVLNLCLWDLRHPRILVPRVVPRMTERGNMLAGRA